MLLGTPELSDAQRKIMSKLRHSRVVTGIFRVRIVDSLKIAISPLLLAISESDSLFVEGKIAGDRFLCFVCEKIRKDTQVTVTNRGKFKCFVFFLLFVRPLFPQLSPLDNTLLYRFVKKK